MMLLQTKKKQESLSPEQKIKVMTIDAAAHKKKWESLSPEQKVKVMTIDAAAHKKHWVASPGEKS